MDVQRILLVLGAVLLVLGLAWPWLGQIGLGRLPGDIVIERGGTRIYLPIATSVLVSAVLSLVLWLLGR